MRGHAQAPLPPGAVTPAVVGANLADPPLVAEAVDDVLGAASASPAEGRPAAAGRRREGVDGPLRDGARAGGRPGRDASLASPQDRAVQRGRGATGLEPGPAHGQWRTGVRGCPGATHGGPGVRAGLHGGRNSCRAGRSAGLQSAGHRARARCGGRRRGLAARAHRARVQYPGRRSGPAPAAVPNRHLGRASRWATSCTRPRCTTKTAWGAAACRTPSSAAAMRRRTAQMPSSASSKIGSPSRSNRSPHAWRPWCRRGTGWSRPFWNGLAAPIGVLLESRSTWT